VDEFRLRCNGLTAAFNPLGDTEVERLMRPVKPLRLVKVIVDVADDLACIRIEEGLGNAE